MGRKLREIDKLPFQIGRSSRHTVFGTNDLNLIDIEPFTISRCHCLISIVGNDYYLVDTVSSLGTIINDLKIGGREKEKRALLTSGTHHIVLGGENSPYVFELYIP